MNQRLTTRVKLRAIIVVLTIMASIPLSAQSYWLELGNDSCWRIYDGTKCIIEGHHDTVLVEADLQQQIKIDSLVLTYDGRSYGYLEIRGGDNEWRGAFSNNLGHNLIDQKGELSLTAGRQYTFTHGGKKWEITFELKAPEETPSAKEHATTVVVEEQDDHTIDNWIMLGLIVLLAASVCVNCICIAIMKKKHRNDPNNLKAIGEALGLPENLRNLENIRGKIKSLRDETESLRNEMNTLREEVRQIKEGKSGEKGERAEGLNAVRPNPFQIKGFNVPKNEAGSEDADPYDVVGTDKSWGVIGVFDGMGGAGHREYTHKKTQEKHTSAWWASRYVRETVEKTIKEIKGLFPDRPVTEMNEEGLYKLIKEKLDVEICNFDTESAVKSKMIRKLPTTLAMCAYEIKNGRAHVSMFWAGDSRIYLLDTEGMSFLTIDDANAPDGDPFSPENMDLAMTNTICQDQPFHINKCETVIPLRKDSPIVLLACTDGCFAYYKNPIEFELMVRRKLEDSNNWDEWSDGMRDAIIENGQGDDLSLVGVAFEESESFETFKQKMRGRLDAQIFKDYDDWKNKMSDEEDDMKKAISDLDNCINDLKKEISEIGTGQNSSETIEESAVKNDAPSDQNIIKTSDDIPEKDCAELANELDAEGKEKNQLEILDSTERSKTLEEKKKEIENLKGKQQVNKQALDNLQLSAQEENNAWYKKMNYKIIGRENNA